MTIFIDGAIKGEKAKILIVKVLSNYAYGKLLEIIEKSDMRENVDCATYQRCGGCNLRHMKYEETLKLKENIVKTCFYKALNEDIAIQECIGMENPIGYRNKLVYPVRVNKDGKIIMGVFAKRSHNIIETNRCFLQNSKNEEIANYTLKLLRHYDVLAYDEENKTGSICHIMIRNGYRTGEVMLVIVSKTNCIPNEKKIVDDIRNTYPEVKTIIKNINEKETNVILGDTNVVLYGRGYIYDIIEKYKFKISPLSFYQINPIQTEILYKKAIEFSGLTGNEVVFDLYCGVGTIGILATKKAKKVYGIETVKQAIDDAKENAKNNNIKNIEFIMGDVENVLPNLVKKDEADVVFIDPPRKGCDRKTIETLLNMKPRKLVYVSCNPATLARDVSILKQFYDIKKIQPVDMFPFTSHVECVSLLCLK